MSKRIEDDAGLLYDFLVDSPDGITWEDASRKFGWKHRTYFFRVIRKLRLILGDDDEMTVICDPRGMRETWLYQLVGDPELAYPWQANRIGDMEARLETVLSVSTSVAKNVDGRTLVGKKSRRIKATVGYLLGELAQLSEETE
jgi:hypothetical protein